MLQASEGHTKVSSIPPWVRISDRDREIAGRRLRDAASAGALSVTEFDRRLDRVLSATTRGDLAVVLLDLPGPHPAGRSNLRRWLRPHAAAYAIVTAGLTAIWAAAGFGYFWPVWPMIGWGMLLAGHAYAACSGFAIPGRG